MRSETNQCRWRYSVATAAVVVWSLACLTASVAPAAATTGREAFGSNSPFADSAAKLDDTRQQARVEYRDLEDVVGRLIKAVISIAGVFFFGYIVWAGYLWMTAHGEEEKITQAKKMISGGVIGLAIVLAAYAITQFVVTKLSDSTGIQ